MNLTVLARLAPGHYGSLALVAAAVIYLASALIVGTPPDDEEFRFAVLTSWLHARTLAQGDYAFWTSLMGFGIPQPLIPNFWFHPILPLLAVVSAAMWARILLLIHLVVGAAGMWRLCRAQTIRPSATAVCVCTFLLSAPALNYLLSDFWPSHWIVWTTMPWILHWTWRVLEDEPRHAWTSSLWLGLTTGLVTASANPAYIVVYAVLASALIVGRWREVIARWRPLAVAAFIGLAIALPNVLLLASERGLFDPEMALSNVRDPLPLRAAWDVFTQPLSWPGSPWRADILSRGTRTLLLGGPFAILCLVGCVSAWRRRRELVVGAVLSAVFVFTTAGPIEIVSQRYQFRDPLILCAVLLAGLAAERALRDVRTRLFTGALLAVQVVVLAATAHPFVQQAWEEETYGPSSWFDRATAQTPTIDALVQSVPSPGRMLFSPKVDARVRDHSLLQWGLSDNSLAYRDIPVVSGSFKGVSTDAVSPDDRLFYGSIESSPILVESDLSLDMLGIRYVLAERSETVAFDLRERRIVSIAESELVLYENDDAWPGGFILDEADEHLDVPVVVECGHSRLLCRDLSVLAQRGDGHADVGVERSGGDIEVTFPPLERASLLVVTEMFRPEWRATSGSGDLEVRAFVGSLLAVRLPAGASSVQFAYRPVAMIWASVAAWCAVVGCLVALAWRRLINGAPG